MKYRKKAIEVNLIEFTGEPNNYVKTRINNSTYIWNNLHKSEINIEIGDFINISTPDDYYPIKKSIVESTYEKVE